MKDTRIAAVISHSKIYDVDYNLIAMDKWLKSANDSGVKIVCFPELNISGYIIDKKIIETAEEIPGRISEKLSNLSIKYNIVILAGMLEKDKNNHIYSSHLVVKPEGYIGVYRKLHIAPVEKDLFCQGDKVRLFEVQGLKFGIQLCYDAHFPELSTSMALMGADVIFFPHASPRKTPDEKLKSWLRHLTARAFDNSVFVVACNQCSKDPGGLFFPGTGLIINPSGNVIKKYTGENEKMIISDLKAKDIDLVRNHKMRYFLPNRRPDIY
ncbi:MAG: nitrilase-related carbon-nitrogen hydrolase [Pseudomonadota bacterium]